MLRWPFCFLALIPISISKDGYSSQYVSRQCPTAGCTGVPRLLGTREGTELGTSVYGAGLALSAAPHPEATQGETGAQDLPNQGQSVRIDYRPCNDVWSDASTLRPVGDPPPRSRSPDIRRGYRHGNHPPVSGHHPVAKRSPSPLPWRRHRSRSRTPPPHSRSDGRLPGAMVASRPSPPPHWRRSDRQGLPETYYEKCVHWLVTARGIHVHVCLSVCLHVPEGGVVIARGLLSWGAVLCGAPPLRPRPPSEHRSGWV